MRAIIAGSRELGDPKAPNLVSDETVSLVANAVEASGWSATITEVVSGRARGIDLAGEAWARSWGIPITEFPADWDQLGKRAGYVRNEAMADYGDALIAIYDGTSKGTKHMIDIAVRKGLHVFIYETRRIS